MMKIKSGILAASLALLLAPLAVKAEGWLVGLHPGYSMIVGQGTTDDVFEGSPALQLSAEYLLSDALSAGLEFGYSFGHPFEGSVDSSFGSFDFTSDLDLKVYQITPVVKFRREMGAWGPYAVLGAGLYQMPEESGTQTISNIPPPNNTQAVTIESDSNFGVNVGVGAMFNATETFGLGVEVRFHNQFESGDDLRFVNPSLRLTYKFGA